MLVWAAAAVGPPSVKPVAASVVLVVNADDERRSPSGIGVIRPGPGPADPLGDPRLLLDIQSSELLLHDVLCRRGYRPISARPPPPPEACPRARTQPALHVRAPPGPPPGGAAPPCGRPVPRRLDRRRWRAARACGGSMGTCARAARGNLRSRLPDLRDSRSAARAGGGPWAGWCAGAAAGAFGWRPGRSSMTACYASRRSPRGRERLGQLMDLDRVAVDADLDRDAVATVVAVFVRHDLPTTPDRLASQAVEHQHRSAKVRAADHHEGHALQRAHGYPSVGTGSNSGRTPSASR